MLMANIQKEESLKRDLTVISKSSSRVIEQNLSVVMVVRTYIIWKGYEKFMVLKYLIINNMTTKTYLPKIVIQVCLRLFKTLPGYDPTAVEAIKGCNRKLSDW